jgi:hypothetical protein
MKCTLPVWKVAVAFRPVYLLGPRHMPTRPLPECRIWLFPQTQSPDVPCEQSTYPEFSLHN